MAQYKKLNSSQVEKDYNQKRIIDMAMYLQEEVPSIVDQYVNTPAPKDEPDQETLDFWNDTNANPEELQRLKDRMYYIIYEVLQATYDAGAMPDDWVSTFEYYKDYYDNNLSS